MTGRTLCLLAVVAALLSIACAGAASRQIVCDPGMFDRRLERALAYFQDRYMGFPRKLRTNRDVYVVFVVGVSYTDVWLLGRRDIPGARLAEALDRATAGTILNQGPVRWAKKGRFSAAAVGYSESSIGRRRASISMPVGAVVARMRSSGLKPHALLLIAKSALGRVEPWMPADISGVDRRARLQTRAELPAATAVLGWLVILVYPGLAVTGFLAAILVGRTRRIPIDRRRRLFQRIANYPLLVGIVLELTLVEVLARSDSFPLLIDLWSGAVDPRRWMTPAFAVLIGTAVCFAVVSGAVARKLFGAEDDGSKTDETAELRSARRRLTLLMLAPTVVAGALILSAVMWLPHGSWLDRLVLPVALSIIFFGGPVVLFLFRPLMRDLLVTSTDRELTEQAERIAQALRVRLGAVKIDETVLGKHYALAALFPRGRVGVTRKMLEVLSPEEIDFILAHELAHLKSRDILKNVLLVLALIAGQELFFRLSHAFGARSDYGYTLFLLGVAAFAFLFFGRQRINRWREIGADRRALAATGDLGAAKSALVNLVKHSPLPHLNEVEDFSTHPSISRRLQMLDAAARELGLPEKYDQPT